MPGQFRFIARRQELAAIVPGRHPELRQETTIVIAVEDDLASVANPASADRIGHTDENRFAGGILHREPVPRCRNGILTSGKCFVRNHKVEGHLHRDPGLGMGEGRGECQQQAKPCALERVFLHDRFLLGVPVRPELAITLARMHSQNNGSAMNRLGHESDRLRN